MARGNLQKSCSRWQTHRSNENKMRSLKILLLGPPEVLWGEKTLSISRRFPRSLLYYLASSGRMVSRQELFPLFWEDRPDTVARLRLRETINKLRSALPDPGLLLTEANLIGLDQQRITVDQREFQVTIDQAGQIPWIIPASEPLPDFVRQLLQKALDLWRGPHFMTGANLPSTHALDEWLIRTAQHLEHQRSRILERLSDDATSIGDLERALSIARKASEVEELNDGLHERILGLLLRMGRRSEAQEYVVKTIAPQQKELKLSLSPTLSTLLQQTQSNAGQIHPEFTVKIEARTCLQTPFIGREAILSQLNAAYHKAGLCFIVGESGLGKTRLIQELVDRLDTKPRILLAQCNSSESQLPLQPILDVCRNQIRAEEWKLIPSSRVSQLFPLLPELREIRKDKTDLVSGDPIYTNSQFVEALRQVMLWLASTRRLLFILDNAQWADDATLDALTYLSMRPPFNSQGSILVALRTDEDPSRFDKLLSGHSSNVGVTRLQVPMMNFSEINDLTRTVFKRTPTPEFGQQILDDTGGNPLYILEIYRCMLETSPQPDFSSVEDLPLPANLHTLVQERISSLSPQSQRTLEITALLGDEFDTRTVFQVSQDMELKVVEAIDDLYSRNLIEPIPTESPTSIYAFIHRKIRQSVLQEISPVRRQYLQNRINLLGRNSQPDPGGLGVSTAES